TFADGAAVLSQVGVGARGGPNLVVPSEVYSALWPAAPRWPCRRSDPRRGGSDMPATSSTDGVGIASRFSLTVDDVDLASFSDLHGITSEADPERITAIVMKKLPGKRTPPTVTLKRGLSRDLQISAWHDSVIDGQLAAARKSCSLVMYDTKG